MMETKLVKISSESKRKQQLHKIAMMIAQEENSKLYKKYITQWNKLMKLRKSLWKHYIPKAKVRLAKSH